MNRRKRCRGRVVLAEKMGKGIKTQSRCMKYEKKINKKILPTISLQELSSYLTGQGQVAPHS